VAAQETFCTDELQFIGMEKGDKPNYELLNLSKIKRNKYPIYSTFEKKKTDCYLDCLHKGITCEPSFWDILYPGGEKAEYLEQGKLDGLFRSREDRTSEDRTREDRTTEDRTSEDRISEDRTSEDRISDDRTSKDRISEDRTSEASNLVSRLVRIELVRIELVRVELVRIELVRIELVKIELE
ncbi:hypothetical protein Tco_0444532, partial [Tanacetum coccineum]